MQGIYIDELGLNFVKTCFKTYVGDVCFFGVFIACIFLLFIRPQKLTKSTSAYVLLLFLTIFNPFLVKLFFSYFHQDDVYYRFFWLLPVNLVIAYSATHLIFKLHRNAKKFFTSLIIICTIIFLGSPVIYFSSLSKLPDNLYKVTDDVLEISEIIHQNSDSNTLYVAPASDLLMTIRQYDPSIILTLERDRVLCWQGAPLFQSLSENGAYQAQKPIMDVIYGGDTSNPTKFLSSIEITKTQYLVYSKDVNISSFLEDLSYQYIGETDNYIIYKTTQL